MTSGDQSLNIEKVVPLAGVDVVLDGSDVKHFKWLNVVPIAVKCALCPCRYRYERDLKAHQLYRCRNRI